MKICLLGLPRCGSQHISRLIRNSFHPIHTILAEPFTIGDRCVDYVDGNVIQVFGLTFDSMQSRVDHILTTLKKSPDQDIIMKLFFLDYLEPYLPQIVNELQNLEFKFIVISREVESQLLSFGIALSTDQWNSNNGVYQKGFLVNVNNFPSIKWLYSLHCNFDNTFKKLNISPLGVVAYETAVEDLSAVFGMQMNPNSGLKKQITCDPYDIIENAAEVKEFIKKIQNETHIY